MRITIDASSLSYPQRTGIGRCLESILPHLASLAAASGWRITLVSGRPIVNAAALALLDAGAIGASTVNLPSLYAWQQAGMAWQIKEAGSDVHYAPDGLLPIGFTGPCVGVVNDVLGKRIPETLPRHIRWVFGLRQKASLARLTIPLTLSAFTRREMLRLYGEMAARTRPTNLCAVDHDRFRPSGPDARDDAAALADFRSRHGLRDGFFLCVGNLMPHKNLAVGRRGHGQIARRPGAGRGRTRRCGCLGRRPAAGSCARSRTLPGLSFRQRPAPGLPGGSGLYFPFALRRLRSAAARSHGQRPAGCLCRRRLPARGRRHCRPAFCPG
jgi:hypothetical protein